MNRTRAALGLIVVVACGLATRRIGGPPFLRDALGDTLYAAAACLFLRLLFPKMAAWRAAGGAWAGCAVVEFGQLFHPPWLDAIRHTAPGRLLLGWGFAWTDLLWYALGAACLPGTFAPSARALTFGVPDSPARPERTPERDYPA